MDPLFTPPTLLRSPSRVLRAFSCVCQEGFKSLLTHSVVYWGRTCVLISLVSGLRHFLSYPPPPALQWLHGFLSVDCVYALYWMTLGVLSSVGLGSGLHTFVLYLAPHMMRVCSEALQAHTTDFSARIERYVILPPPSWDLQGLSLALAPQYAPNAWVPRSGGGGTSDPTLLAMWAKVAWPAVLWGFGTALGELPPYFIARAAQRAGQAVGELEEARKLSEEGNEQGGPARAVTEPPSKRGGAGKRKSAAAAASAVAMPQFTSTSASLSSSQTSSSSSSSNPLTTTTAPPFLERCKVGLFLGVQKYGFWAILLAASIPNPLFDLAGLTCGHVGISFFTFFSATVIGKALFKALLLQAGSLVVLFRYGPQALGWLEERGVLSPSALGRLRGVFACHPALGGGGEQCRNSNSNSASGNNTLGMVWGWILLVMVGTLLASIVESLAQEQVLRERGLALLAEQKEASRRKGGGGGGGGGGVSGGAAVAAVAASTSALSPTLSAAFSGPSPTRMSTSPSATRGASGKVLSGTLASALVNRKDLRRAVSASPVRGGGAAALAPVMKPTGLNFDGVVGGGEVGGGVEVAPLARGGRKGRGKRAASTAHRNKSH